MIGKGKARAGATRSSPMRRSRWRCSTWRCAISPSSERWLRDYQLASSPVGLLPLRRLSGDPRGLEGGASPLPRGSDRKLGGRSVPARRRTRPMGEVVGWPWRDSDGEIGGIILTTEDITARKEAEAEAAHLASVVTHSSDAIIAKTLDSIVTSWNAGATRLLGYSAEEMIGQLDRPHHPAGTPRRGGSDPRAASRRRSHRAFRDAARRQGRKRPRRFAFDLADERTLSGRSSARRRSCATSPRKTGPSANWPPPPRSSPPSTNRRRTGFWSSIRWGGSSRSIAAFAEIFGIPHELLAARDDRGAAGAGLATGDGRRSVRAPRAIPLRPSGRIRSRRTGSQGWSRPRSLYVAFQDLGRRIAWVGSGSFATSPSAGRPRKRCAPARSVSACWSRRRPTRSCSTMWTRIASSPRTRPPNACSALRATKFSERGPQRFFAPEQPDGRPAAESFLRSTTKAPWRARK